MHCRLRIARVFCLGIALLCVTKLAPAAVIVSDDFSATKHPSGFRTTPAPGLGGIPWYLARTGSGTAAITTESGVGTTLNSDFLSVSGVSGTSTPVIGLLGGTASLATVSDILSVNFRFRFLNDASDGNANFRFGFHNSTTTPVTGDGPVAVTDNDLGYYAQIGDTAQTTNNLFYRENGGTTLILSGTDRANLVASSVFNAFNDTLPHTANLTLTRTNATTITLSLSVDGGAAVTATTSASLVTSFDEITFSNGFGATNLNFGIDDVVVDATSFTAVPEPTTLGFAAAGLLGLWALRRKAEA